MGAVAVAVAVAVIVVVVVAAVIGFLPRTRMDSSYCDVYHWKYTYDFFTCKRCARISAKQADFLSESLKLILSLGKKHFTADSYNSNMTTEESELVKIQRLEDEGHAFPKFEVNRDQNLGIYVASLV